MRVRHILCYSFLLFIFYFFYLSCKSEVFFSPQDKISDKLVEKINKAQKKIYVAVYMFTDKKIADALIEAKNKRGIDVQVITDQMCLECKFGKVEQLKNEGIDVFVFKHNLKNKRHTSKIMHNKFAILDNFIWTGSFNWTVQANYRNRENVICTDNQLVYKKYCEEFNLLKKGCTKQVLKQEINKKIYKNETLKENYLRSKLIDLLKLIRDKFY